MIITDAPALYEAGTPNKQKVLSLADGAAVVMDEQQEEARAESEGKGSALGWRRPSANRPKDRNEAQALHGRLGSAWIPRGDHHRHGRATVPGHLPRGRRRKLRPP
ncbi:hypothetical protein [Pseudomonas alloputida]|uniref:hypothetical protein n=1 Tax=Pseudomonas alloputida TaxID=1940621 RepID=UPI003D9A9B5E